MTASVFAAATGWFSRHDINRECYHADPFQVKEIAGKVLVYFRFPAVTNSIMWANTVWGFIGLAATLLFAGVPMIIDPSPELGRLLIVASGSCFVASVLVFIWPLRGRLSSRFYFPWQLVPMQEATTRAYEQLRKNSSLWSDVADRFSDSNLAKTPEEGTLLYIATAFATQKVPLYGKHPPSRLYELIDQAEFGRGRFQNSGAVFQYVGKNQPPLYCDIAIKAADLRKAISKMKKDSSLAI